MDLLLFPGGIVGIVVVLFLYLRKQRGVRHSIYGRTVRVIESNLNPISDIESGYAAVASSMRALRRAKQEEHQLLLRNWQNSYLALLPDTDPEKMTHQAQLQGVKIQNASFTLDANGMKIDAGTITTAHISAKSISADELPVVDDGPEWTPLPYTRSKKDPDENMSYNDRRIQSAGAFVRSEPHTKASTYGVATGGDVLHFDGYVHGEAVAGNTIWFVYIGKSSGLRKYVHSIATTNRSISGMRNLTLPNMTYEGGSQAIQMPVAEVARRSKVDRLTKNLELGKSKPAKSKYLL